MAKIQFEITDDLAVKTISKITGSPATAWLETINQWLVTQTVSVPDGNGGATQAPKYADAVELLKANAIDLHRALAPQFPSATLTADVAEITAKIAALEAKKQALFDAAMASV